MNKKLAMFCFLLSLLVQIQAATSSQTGEGNADAKPAEARTATASKPPPVDAEMQSLESCIGPEQSKAVKDASQQRLMQKITQASLDATERSTDANRAAEIRHGVAVEMMNALMRERSDVKAELSRLCEAKRAQ